MVTASTGVYIEFPELPYLQGAGVFWAGNALQFWSHWILASLQRTTKQTQTTKSRAGNQYYKMPTGTSMACCTYPASID